VTSGQSGLLIVAATRPELCGWEGLVCGVGPVEAAAATAGALAQTRPRAVLHVGVAGAKRGGGPEVGGLAVGLRAVYEDLSVPGLIVPREAVPAPALVRAAAAALGVEPVVIGTSARVGGAPGCPVEAMEGFGVLRACELADVPAVEVRAISNHFEDSRADWKIEQALAALAQALPTLVASITDEKSASA
jgi:nucleoside phosphorylase